MDNKKILIGVLVLVVAVIAGYFLLGGKKDTVKTTTSTTSGLAGLDLGGILGALGSLQTKNDAPTAEQQAIDAEEAAWSMRGVNSTFAGI